MDGACSPILVKLHGSWGDLLISTAQHLCPRLSPFSPALASPGYNPRACPVIFSCFITAMKGERWFLFSARFHSRNGAETRLGGSQEYPSHRCCFSCCLLWRKSFKPKDNHADPPVERWAHQKAFLLADTAQSQGDLQTQTKPCLQEDPGSCFSCCLHRRPLCHCPTKRQCGIQPSSTGFAFAISKVLGLENQPQNLYISHNWVAKLQPSKTTLLPLPAE